MRPKTSGTQSPENKQTSLLHSHHNSYITLKATRYHVTSMLTSYINTLLNLLHAQQITKQSCNAANAKTLKHITLKIQTCYSTHILFHRHTASPAQHTTHILVYRHNTPHQLFSPLECWQKGRGPTDEESWPHAARSRPPTFAQS